jgi:hypothetical protein
MAAKEAMAAILVTVEMFFQAILWVFVEVKA